MSGAKPITEGLGATSRTVAQGAVRDTADVHTTWVEAVTASPTRVQTLVWVAILAFAMILSLREYGSFQLGTYGDDAAYVLLARSIAEGDQYGLINTPGVEPGVASFPFGYPLLLAPFALGFPGDPEPMRVLSLVATVTNAAILFWGWTWFSRRSRWWGLAVAGLYLLSPLVVSGSRMVMSEPIFTTFCLVAVLLTERLAQDRYAWWHVPLLGVALAFAFFLRTIGIVALLFAAGYLVLRLRRRSSGLILLILSTMVLAFVAVVETTPIAYGDAVPLRYLDGDDAAMARTILSLFPAGWVPSNSASPSQDTGEPADESRLDARTFLEYTVYWGLTQHLGHDARRVVIPVGGSETEEELAQRLGFPYLRSVLAIGFMLVLLVGVLRWITSEPRKAGLVFAFVYFSALLLWSWNDPRFLYPMQPQLVFAFLLGIEALTLWVARLVSLDSARRWQSILLVGVTLILGMLSARASLAIEDSRHHVGDLQARTAWIRAHTAPDDIVLTEQPVLDYLYGERSTVEQPRDVASGDALAAFLAEREIDYVLVAPRLLWQPTYDPQYSETTLRLLALADVLVQRGQLERAYHADDQRLKVFRVQTGR